MPIRLNLLAEVQAAEDLRRRDPVKRAVWIGGLLAAVMLVWASSVEVKIMVAKRALTAVQSQITQRAAEYKQVTDNQKKVEEIERKLGQLHKLASSRFLQGNLLNALQQTTVDDVQLTRVAVKQEYLLTEEAKGKTNTEGVVTAGKPATVKESVTVTLEAKDAAPVPGDQVNPFKEALSTNAYFMTMLGKTNEVRLINVSPRNPPTANDNGRAFVTFLMEVRYPEKTR
jgi:hypothetical protein